MMKNLIAATIAAIIAIAAVTGLGGCKLQCPKGQHVVSGTINGVPQYTPECM